MAAFARPVPAPRTVTAPRLAPFSNDDSEVEEVSVSSPKDNNADAGSDSDPVNAGSGNPDSESDQGSVYSKPKSSVHNVLPIESRRAIVKWMVQQEKDCGGKNLCSLTIKQFPQFFRASGSSSNFMRAKRLWNSRSMYTGKKCVESTMGLSTDNPVHARALERVRQQNITRVTKSGAQRARVKAFSGRGRKRAAWVEALHTDLRSEFDRLRRLGVKFSHSTLRSLALDVLSNSTSTEYSSNFIDPKTDMPLYHKINGRWIQSFMERYHIVSRAHTGKHKCSPAKEEELALAVAVHLGTVSGLFSSGKLEENFVENADETHFIINVDNGRTLGFAGDKTVKYADVVSGGEGFTMAVRLTGGRDAKIAPPFMIFKNKDRNYPIKNVPDDVPGVAYRTGPKGWMDRTVMPEWLSEKRIISKIRNGRRVLFVDNCSGHATTDELSSVCAAIDTEIRYFPPNTTHLVQPCDSFVIQKIKRAWSTHWEKYKMECIKKNKWKDSSGKLRNPGKTFFLQLAAKCVREVNLQRDENGLSFARKAMIITGLALNTNGSWEVGQLTPDLQNIISSHKSVFDAARAKAMESNDSSSSSEA